MALSFAKLSSVGLPKLGARFAKMAKDKKASSISLPKPKTNKMTTPKAFDISKFTKVAKVPKAAKVKLLKAAVKKAKKNVGY